MTINECRTLRRTDARVIFGLPDALLEQQAPRIAGPASAVETRRTLQGRWIDIFAACQLGDAR